MHTNSLLHGPILKALVKLAFPIMGTAFLQMSYNMVNMIWLGHLGSGAVAAAGTAGFFMWLGMAFILVSKTGAEIGVAQSIGRQDHPGALSYAQNAIQLNLILSVGYALFLLTFRTPLMAFFQLSDPEVIKNGVNYLAIIAIGMPFAFITPVFTAVYNGYGNSRTPFHINTLGLVLNMILDPLLIYGPGPFPAWGVEGAAVGTVLAQLIVAAVFAYRVFVLHEPLGKISIGHSLNLKILKKITAYGLPVAVQSGMFTLFAMFIARVISQWGPMPIAVQKVGAQIEAISWMTASGFSTALSTFVGQNYGARNWKRIIKGYLASIGTISLVGIVASLLLIFCGAPIFSLFLPESQAVAAGAVYLKILGYSQLFMCIEITTSGAFNGLGKTVPPAISSILLTGARVPAAIFLSSPALLGLEGVWWSISISSILKGIVLMGMFAWMISRIPEVRALSQEKEIQM